MWSFGKSESMYGINDENYKDTKRDEFSLISVAMLASTACLSTNQVKNDEKIS